ncbi:MULTISPECIES: hypothetical protein [Arthrobacter]|uniref:hypothetical protein n=1 Tax=unclassified Arthrobacter TaxID=235627 RepID=UPI0024B8E904|nr:hypothetical protein [Arthrobacter sp. H35-MC1]MDJ0318855.1 hypothetical protein [Arthrobacter sp. H35-MC1]
MLVAALMLPFTGRYLRPLLDLVMGINPWNYRVAGYTLLPSDEYPPFRLDQGPEDPDQRNVRAGMNFPRPNAPLTLLNTPLSERYIWAVVRTLPQPPNGKPSWNSATPIVVPQTKRTGIALDRPEALF